MAPSPRKVKKMYKVKFYSSTLRSRLVPILKYIHAGNYPAKIARVLGLSRQHVHYYIKKMRKAGLIKRSRVKWPAFYSLTPRGKKVLTRCERLAPGFLFRLHNVVFRYPLLACDCELAGWVRVQKRNWAASFGKVLGVRVEKTTRHILVYCDVVEGYGPDELLLRAKDQADRVAVALQVKYGMKVGLGKLCRKPHFGVYDPVAALMSKYVQLSDDVAKIDESETYGEIDWLSERAAKDYLLMPGNVRGILAALNEFAQGMRDHRAMIKEIRELVEELRRTKGGSGS